MKTMKSNLTRNIILVIICGFAGVYLWQIIAHVISTIVYVKITGSKELAKQSVQNNEWLTNIFNVGMELVLLWIIYYFVKKIESKQSFLPAMNLDWKENSRKQFLLGISIATVINIMFWSIAVLTQWVHISLNGFSSYSALQVIGYTFIMGIITLFPGVCEEVFFRGYLQKRLLVRKGKWFSLVITSLLFIIFHLGRYQNVAVFFYLFIMSMFLGYLYYKSGSLYLTIGFHYFWDFLASIFGEGNVPSLFVIKIANQMNVMILYTILLAVGFLLVFLQKGKPLLKVNRNTTY